MKTMFDKTVREEVLNRVRSVSKAHKAKWGKMNVFQMARHCSTWDSWILGKDQYKDHVYTQDFLGRLFGKMALRSNTKNDKPIGRNMPAGKDFVIKEKEGDVEAQKAIWMDLITGYEHFSNDRFIHDFFGKMSKEQIGIFAYKHVDHHLRQFGA
jgi:hypothetical protein